MTASSRFSHFVYRMQLMLLSRLMMKVLKCESSAFPAAGLPATPLTTRPPSHTAGQAWAALRPPGSLPPPPPPLPLLALPPPPPLELAAQPPPPPRPAAP